MIFDLKRLFSIFVVAFDKGFQKGSVRRTLKINFKLIKEFEEIRRKYKK